MLRNGTQGPRGEASLKTKPEPVAPPQTTRSRPRHSELRVPRDDVVPRTLRASSGRRTRGDLGPGKTIVVFKREPVFFFLMGCLSLILIHNSGTLNFKKSSKNKKGKAQVNLVWEIRQPLQTPRVRSTQGPALRSGRDTRGPGWAPHRHLAHCSHRHAFFSSKSCSPICICSFGRETK